MHDVTPRPPLRLRTVFISDVHLGFKGCRADLLLISCITWKWISCSWSVTSSTCGACKKSMYWPQAHNNVLRTILGKPARHQSDFRPRQSRRGIPRIRRSGSAISKFIVSTSNRGADGRRMLVLHGDEFDSVVKCQPVAREIGQRYLRRAVGGESLHQLGAAQARICRTGRSRRTSRQARPPFSTSAASEDAVAQAARKRGVDTVVCGHYPSREMRDITDSVLQ